MKTIIKKYNVKYVWHFTDKSNLESIEKYEGLLSLKVLNDKGINIPIPGSNELSRHVDKTKGLDKFVHLCFLDNHPMQFLAVQEGRIKEPIWLKIDSSVILDPNVKFTSKVSNASGVPILDHRKAIEDINFEILFTFIDWRGKPAVHEERKAAEKSEILVPDIVPIDKILGYKNG